MQNLSADQVDALKTAVLSLYKLGTDTDAVVSTWYSEDAEFRDLLVFAKGRSYVQAQFRSLSMMFKDVTTEVVGTGIVGGKLVIEANIAFFPRLMPRFFAFRVVFFMQLLARVIHTRVIYQTWCLAG
eukprot:TRINITY_DN24117_c0_g1_i1.p1 TRINITY_DN24117_c0_g1~~TRINITY_DN24117_c0_g1_i1.p1  ORF type:complete len:127 (+),score=12.63 TRINITY_DN24117_c0_g1_i1:80-460(+)